MREFLRASVRVCARVEQPADQRERFVADTGALVGRAELEVAQVHSRPERRLAVPIHRVHVGARVEQSVGDSQVIAAARAAHAEDARVQDRFEQRCDAVAVGELRTRAALDEQRRGGEVARARGVEQRGLRAGGRKALAAVRGPARADDADALRQAGRRLARRDETRRGLGARLRVRIGARVEQGSRELEATRAHGDHQRRLPVAYVAAVNGRAVIEQRARDLRLADARGEHQRRLAGAVELARVGAGPEEPPHERRIAGPDRDRERRHAVAIDRVDLGARGEQPRDEIGVAETHDPVQRGRAVAVRSVDVLRSRVE